jgi:hypothetical protein
VLINWLSMPAGKELLVEMVGHGAQAALLQHQLDLMNDECDSGDCQTRLMDAARQTASDDDSIPGTNMLLSVVQVRSPNLTVGFSQSSYILMAYRVVGTVGLRRGA